MRRSGSADATGGSVGLSAPLGGSTARVVDALLPQEGALREPGYMGREGVLAYAELDA